MREGIQEVKRCDCCRREEAKPGSCLCVRCRGRLEKGTVTRFEPHPRPIMQPTPGTPCATIFCSNAARPGDYFCAACRQAHAGQAQATPAPEPLVSRLLRFVALLRAWYRG